MLDKSKFTMGVGAIVRDHEENVLAISISCSLKPYMYDSTVAKVYAT